MRDFIDQLRARRVTPRIAVDGHLFKLGKPRSTLALVAYNLIRLPELLAATA